MKKLIFIIVAIFTLCSCSSDNEDLSYLSNVKDEIHFEGKVYEIIQANATDSQIILIGKDYLGEYCQFWLSDCEGLNFQGKNLLNTFGWAKATIRINDEYKHIWKHDTMNSDSYVTIKKDVQDGSSYIELKVSDNESNISATFFNKVIFLK